MTYAGAVVVQAAAAAAAGGWCGRAREPHVTGRRRHFCAFATAPAPPRALAQSHSAQRRPSDFTQITCVIDDTTLLDVAFDDFP